MLKPPYTRYDRIYTYHVDGSTLPAPYDPDLIGTWEEDDKTILIFHRPKDELVRELCRKHSCRLFTRQTLITLTGRWAGRSSPLQSAP